MSTTQTQSLEDLIIQEADAFGLKHFHKPYAELSDGERYFAVRAAKEVLRRNIHIPGECDECGARIALDKFLCYPCRKGELPAMSYSLWSKEGLQI